VCRRHGHAKTCGISTIESMDGVRVDPYATSSNNFAFNVRCPAVFGCKLVRLNWERNLTSSTLGYIEPQCLCNCMNLGSSSYTTGIGYFGSRDVNGLTTIAANEVSSAGYYGPRPLGPSRPRLRPAGLRPAGLRPKGFPWICGKFGGKIRGFVRVFIGTGVPLAVDVSVELVE
jgi:hypothetical protein